MKKTIISFILIIVLSVSMLSGCNYSKEISASINVDNLGVDISEDLYGLFLEDISYACDGGLVSNLVSNDSFEYEADSFSNWRSSDLVATVKNDDGLNEKNKNYLNCEVSSYGEVRNLGYVEYYDYLTDNYNKEKMNTADMGFKANTYYKLSLYVRNVTYDGKLYAKLESTSQNEKVEIVLPANTEWTKIDVSLYSNATEDGGLLFIFEGNGEIDLDFVTLESMDSYGYGTEEWKYVSLREDLYQALSDLNPSFIRFPGGCLAEGNDLETLFSWKNTIGPLENREHAANIWKDDENGKTYDNTFAMGYHEYFQLCDDLSCEPLPILNVGMICQFAAKYNANSKAYYKGKMTKEEWESYLDTVALRPGTSEFDAYSQDILDLIEYANGSVDTTYGSLRAANGHPEPFNLKYIGLGNENWGELYWRNFDVLYNFVKEAHPEITIISSAAYKYSGDYYDEAWDIINNKYADTVVDEHYYTSNNKLFNNNDRYDSYDRDGAQVFVGEYAANCWDIGKLITRNNMWSAIEEASYMTGFERNGDIVKMASYAPTYAKVNSQCWEVNMIWFDSQNIALTPNYYNQMLFSNNVGNKVVNTTIERDKCYSVTTINEETQTIYVKVINASSSSFELNLDVDGFGKVNLANKQFMVGEKGACNELGVTTVKPQQNDCALLDNKVSTTVDGYSINVIRIYYGDNDGSEGYNLPETISTMQDEVTEYTRFYTTPETKMAIFIPLGVVVLAGLIVLAVLMLKKYVFKKNK